MANVAPETASPSRGGPPMPLLRSRRGRWLAGVCSGLGRGGRARTAWIRIGFVAASLAGGLGILAYTACWLIVPLEGAGEEDGESRRAIVALVQVCAAGMALLTLAGIAAFATVFGFGWVVFALGAAVLIAVLAAWPRVAPAWAVLPLIALALPAAAVAGYGVRLDPRTGPLVVRPLTLRAADYRAGLGTTLIDLRRTALPATGTVSLQVAGGVRRTIVALPHDQCVRVDIRYRISPLVGVLAASLADRTFSVPVVVVFGTPHGGAAGEVIHGGPLNRGPELKIEFSSLGGSLYVRDYPDTIRPNLEPNWPGFEVHPEPRPDTRGLRTHTRQELLRSWRARLAQEVRSAQVVNPLLPGPCGPR